MFFVFFLEEFVNLKVTQLLIGNTVWFIQSEVVSLSNSLPVENFLDWSKSKESADRKMNVTNKNEICFGKGGKHCGKRKKTLVTSIFSFSHNVFKIPLLQGL